MRAGRNNGTHAEDDLQEEGGSQGRRLTRKPTPEKESYIGWHAIPVSSCRSFFISHHTRISEERSEEEKSGPAEGTWRAFVLW